MSVELSGIVEADVDDVRSLEFMARPGGNTFGGNGKAGITLAPPRHKFTRGRSGVREGARCLGFVLARPTTGSIPDRASISPDGEKEGSCPG